MSAATPPTDYGFTGQRSFDSEFGLLHFNARWLDPALGRFAQADTIVPNPWNPMAFDRYAYVFNNSLRYTDPSGHCAEDDEKCIKKRNYLERSYGVVITGHWKLLEMNLLEKALTLVSANLTSEKLIHSPIYRAFTQKKPIYRGRKNTFSNLGRPRRTSTLRNALKI